MTNYKQFYKFLEREKLIGKRLMKQVSENLLVVNWNYSNQKMSWMRRKVFKRRLEDSILDLITTKQQIITFQLLILMT